MECLHCGGCCKTMSPRSAPFVCPDLIRRGAYYFCRCYEHSPQLCQKFNFEEFCYCPYGMNELNLSYPKDKEILRERVEQGAYLIAKLKHKN